MLTLPWVILPTPTDAAPAPYGADVVADSASMVHVPSGARSRAPTIARQVTIGYVAACLGIGVGAVFYTFSEAREVETDFGWETTTCSGGQWWEIECEPPPEPKPKPVERDATNAVIAATSIGIVVATAAVYAVGEHEGFHGSPLLTILGGAIGAVAGYATYRGMGGLGLRDAGIAVGALMPVVLATTGYHLGRGTAPSTSRQTALSVDENGRLQVRQPSVCFGVDRNGAASLLLTVLQAEL